MRTRRSNQAKSYAVEKYDFESSGGEAAPEPARLKKRAKAAEKDDEDFDGEAVRQDDDDNDEDEDEDAADAVPEEEDAQQPAEAPHDGAVAQDSPPKDPAPSSSRISQRRRRRPAKAGDGCASLYREPEPVPTDSHAVKSYVGPYERAIRGQSLIKCWYGPRPDRVQLMQRLLDRWINWTVLPPKLLPADALARPAPWAPGAVDRCAVLGAAWRAGCVDAAAQRTRVLTPDEARLYRPPHRPLPVLLGPYPEQVDYLMHPGDAHCSSASGTPYDDDQDEDKVPAGWMLDAGGIVLGMDWAPHKTGVGAQQVLALAVIPHADHDMYDYETEHQKPDFEKHGAVQLWSFAGDFLEEGLVRPSTTRPRLRKTLCFDCGRARRVRWSPDGGGHLAVLCSKGSVCVVDVAVDGDGEYEKVDAPFADLALQNEDGIRASAMAWVSYNRLAIGYTDGSIALWSTHPKRLISRHPVHHSPIVDVATGSPTLPYLVASTPIGGAAKLIDLRSPSCETTEVQINAVHWSHNMLGWSDHLLGFFSGYPSANALNTMASFMHHRHFPLVRRLFTSDCYLSCLAVGRAHPYLLIGTSDGSLWGMNPQCEIFKARRPPHDRIRIFQHEHRPSTLMPQDPPPPERGAARVIQGYAIEKNLHVMPEARGSAAKSTDAKSTPAKKGKKAKAKDDDEPMEEGRGGDEPFSLTDPARGVLNEPLTRITAVEWNPNQDYGCWAAAALGSGLVRVLDLGLENVSW